MSEYSILEEAAQLGAVRAVDLDTGEVLPLPRRREERGKKEGLSHAHISTLEGQPAVLRSWAAGTLFKASRSGPLGFEHSGGGKRGKVKTFSRGSRRRFLYMMGTIQRDLIPLFLTLTYPDNVPDNLADWAKHFERLRERIRRKGWGAIWRREFQVRKSGSNAGKVAPHYHLFVWGATKQELISYISRAWYECCGRIDPLHLKAGSRVEEIRSWGGVKGYAGKYMAKLEDLPGLASMESIGRFWGVINRDAIPWAECVEMTTDDKTVCTFFRMMRRYSHMKMRSSTPSMTILCNDPWQWLEASQKL